MKKQLTILLGIALCLCAQADIRVLSDVKLGEGFFPRFADAETVVYLEHSKADYLASQEDAMLCVDNDNLDLNLYRNGEKTVLKPHGDVNYIWVSLSPNQEMILFNTKHGTGICNLDGEEIINLGLDFDAPVWYGNDYVVGMDDNHDGYYNIESSIMIASVDGKVVKRLTSPEGMGMYPNVDAKSGRVVYNTEDGDIRMLQLNLTEQPIRKELPRMVKQLDGTLLNKLQRQAKRAASKNPADYKIYINPGHGGYDSDDRLMYLYPIFDGTNVREGYTREQSFWESTSNLDKGLRLDTMLSALGFQTKLSRIHNTTEDDRSLSAISAEASDWNADFMLSIHSNAGAPSNYVLQIHSGITPGDPKGLDGYPEQVPEWVCNEARAITTLMGANQYSNEVSCWSKEPTIAGDKTFARTIMGWSNGYGVLRNLRVPGTISEGMMHDYLPETYRLMNIDYKRQESFYFAKTFIEYFCEGELPYGAIGGQLRDDFQKQLFPNYNARKNTRDVLLPINRGKVELYNEAGDLLQTYVTDTLYNGCYFFWNLQPGTYIVKAEEAAYYPKTDTLVVENNKISYANFMMSLRRQTPPEVISYSPNVAIEDSVNVATPIVINFNWDMWEEPTRAAFSITPEVEGTLEFENSQRTLRFTPKSVYAPATEYTVRLATTAAHPDTNYVNTLQEEFVIKFRTKNRPYLQVMNTYPAEGETGVDLKPSIFVLFDQKISKDSKQSLFKVTDNADFSYTPAARNFKKNAVESPYGSVSIDVNEELLPNTQYQLVIDGALKDTDNVVLYHPYVLTFTTGNGQSVEEGEVFHSLDDVIFDVDAENTMGLESKKIMQGGSLKRTEGENSNSIEYTFDVNEKESNMMLRTVQLSQIFRSTDKLIVDIYGDFTFNEVYVEFATEGDLHRYKVCDLDYLGWRTHVLDLSTTDLPTGVDYQCMGFNIVKTQVEPILCNNGHIYLDRLAIVKGQSGETAVENVEASGVEKTPIYDLLGRPTEKKYPYQIYIQDGKKIITNQ
ncbi:MAG: Ig-like domain-containing protein [Paludibacteraceae bacterium]|nr:Ig-like domain-containing protein [Paludibacteraceae bacterium]